jgi:hypothetical protein
VFVVASSAMDLLEVRRLGGGGTFVPLCGSGCTFFNSVVPFFFDDNIGVMCNLALFLCFVLCCVIVAYA